MTGMNPGVDKYLEIGCMRCEFGNTPRCKVHNWEDELVALREILLECMLTEEIKWSMPCYTYNGKNIFILSAFVDFCSLNFFKGALMQDSENLLDKPGENSQATRYMKFTSLTEIKNKKEHIKAYVFEAIEIEKAGLQVQFKKTPEPVPEELLVKFNEIPPLKEAFEALTPGRQRGYILHFTHAKQSKTRLSRIEKYIPKILAGKGFHD